MSSPCPGCARDVPAGARFCPGCGAALLPGAEVSHAPTEVVPLVEPRSSPSQARSSSVTGGLAPGVLLAGRYRIVALLGKGGMGEVYRAEDLRLGQMVALKFLSEALAKDHAARERLTAEVRLSRQVTHPNVCRVHDLEEAEGRVFLTMEYVDGEDLASLVRRIGRLPAAKVVEIAQQLGAGLAAAHEKGVVHRDLKPANVMLDGRGQVRVTDFGLAIAEGDGQGEIVGTPAYMAPEQLAGRAATPLSDVFAFGAVLYELYTGKRPFRTGSLAVATVARATPPDAPSALGAEIGVAEEKTILKCLAEDPAERPASVAAVLAAFPGGDPLAAALARGETPSPELVAAAGEEGRLSLAAAGGLLGAFLVALVALAFLAPHAHMLALLPKVKSSEAMEVRAQEILARLGVKGVVRDEARGVWIAEADVRRALEKSSSRERARVLGSMTRGLGFWYRRSPVPIDGPPLERPDRGTIPPLYYTGEASVQVDSAGRLSLLRAIPSEKPEDERPLDPGPLLRVGGFDPAEVTPTKPIRYLLGGSADTHLAWTAALDGEPVRVEATFWKGQAVGFTVLAPDVPFWRQMPETQLWQGSGADWAMRIVAVFVFVFLLLLARRNAQLGRGDGPGSRRLLTFVLVGMGGGVILQGHYSFHRFYSLFTVIIVICFCVGAAVFVRLAYLAVEPPIRKRYPFLLVSWTRLLSGDYRNSLVARDALIGLTLGTSVSAARALYAALPSWIEIRGVPLIYTAADDLIRKRWVLGKLCEAPLYAIFFGFLVIGVLLLGRMLLRSDGRAWLAPFLLMTLFPIAGGNLALEVVLGMVVAGLYLLALRSGGLLSLVLAFFAFQSLSYTPMGLFEGVWYSGGGLLVVGLLSALAAVAAWLSTGGRAILPRGVLDAVDAE